MKSFFENEEKRSEKPSRKLITERLLKAFPDRTFESDDELFDALAEYDSHIDKRYEKLRNDQSTLATLFISNPKMGGFISEVIGGEDPLVSCVRYFGKDLLECAGDENKMSQLRKENDEYLARMSNARKTENQIAENWRHSEKSIKRFKESKKMSDSDFELFMEKVCHICEHVFMSDFTCELLEILYKGVNYDMDIDAAQEAAEVKGRNEKIIMDMNCTDEDSIPIVNGASSSSGKEKEDNLTPIFGLRRRRSVWDM